MTKDKLKDFYKSKREDKLGWSLVFFWGALVVLAEVTGFSERFIGWDGWSMFFTGFGVICLYAVPFLFYAGNKKAWTNLIFGAIFLSVGLGNLFNFGWIWVVILVAIGYATLKDSFKKK
jgi:hypothetical protein